MLSIQTKIVDQNVVRSTNDKYSIRLLCRIHRIILRHILMCCEQGEKQFVRYIYMKLATNSLSFRHVSGVAQK